jgi:hypothetical protein
MGLFFKSFYWPGYCLWIRTVINWQFSIEATRL